MRFPSPDRNKKIPPSRPEQKCHPSSASCTFSRIDFQSHPPTLLPPRGTTLYRSAVRTTPKGFPGLGLNPSTALLVLSRWDPGRTDAPSGVLWPMKQQGWGGLLPERAGGRIGGRTGKGAKEVRAAARTESPNFQPAPCPDMRTLQTSTSRGTKSPPLPLPQS